MKQVRILTSFLYALGSPVFGGQAWIVDDDGPAGFADLPAAVSAAASGDTILVRDGNYSAFAIDGKAATTTLLTP